MMPRSLISCLKGNKRKEGLPIFRKIIIFAGNNHQKYTTMNCSYHPDRPAVTQCTECGRGLCAECATKSGNSVCADCRNRKRGGSIALSLFYLVLYAVVFYLGYKWDFLFKDMDDHAFMSGYFLIAVIAGWQLCNSLFRIQGVMITLEELGVWTLIKLAIYWIVGLFTAPFVILWNVISIVWQLVRIKMQKQ